MKNNPKPLVSIICLCYNHEQFVIKALESVIFQTYPAVELLIVDDASQDRSVQRIENFIADLPQYCEAFADAPLQAARHAMRVIFLKNEQNQGNCKAFNQALKQAQGKYVIDLAADDVLLDERLAKQVAIFESLPAQYGVVFSNALHIDPHGKLLHYHHKVNEERRSKVPVPSGDVYQAILEKYFISTPTMLIKKEVLEELGGYDEALSYEDFDFWVRSARKYWYYYQDEVTTLKRILPHSHSKGFQQKYNNKHLHSTLEVCKKAKQLNQTAAEHEALIQCVSYHLRQCYFMKDYALLKEYYAFWQQLGGTQKHIKWLHYLAQKRLDFSFLYDLYLWGRRRLWVFK